MVKVKATQKNRIRIKATGDKIDIKKGQVVEVSEDRAVFFLMNGFVRADDVLKKNEIQTTDASTKKVVSKRGKVSKSSK